MYLVYLDKEYFGHTYSKKVVKVIKSMYPTTRVIPCNPDFTRSFEVVEMLADHHKITLFDLEDKYGNKQQVVSTDYEQEEAGRWIGNYCIDKLSVGRVAALELFNNLPDKIRMSLAGYEPIDWQIAEGKDVDDLYDLTYEGYLFYLRYRKEEKVGEPNEDLCLL